MWKRNVKLYYIWSFVSSFVLLGAVLVPFFKRIGLSQLEIQSLQAIFQIMVFVMEVPTGVVGDWLGRKWSLSLHGLLMGIGFWLYSLASSFWMFVLIEVLLAMGVAFRSGSDQALIYDSLKEAKKEKLFGKVLSKSRMLSLTGMMLGSLVGSWSLRFLDISELVKMTGVVLFLAMIISWFFEEPEIISEKEEQRWHEILKFGWQSVVNNQVVRWLIIEGAWLYVLGYFVIWLYQVRLGELKIRIEYFGLFHAALTLMQVVWMGSWRRVFKKIGWEKFLQWSPVIVGIGYVLAGVIFSWIGILIWFALSGVLGLTSKEILSVAMQEHVDSKVRATVISFSGMAKSLTIALINPLVGWLVDWNLTMTFLILGGVGVLGYFVGKKTALVLQENA